MAKLFEQKNRNLVLSTPLGEDALLLTSFGGMEEMSRLFRFRLELLSEQDHIASKDLVGKNINWCVQRVDKEPRYFNGFVNRFAAGGLHQQGGLRSYWLEAVPWLWFLTRSSNCRIFQQMKTPEILETIFKEFGFTDFKLALSRSYPTWDYCVQYRETAFNFVSRLMEHEGMFYFFQHEQDKHTLVVGDQKGAYQDCAENQVEYWSGSLVPNHIDTWEHQYAFRSGKWAQTDYNFETPSTSLLTQTKTVIDLPGVQKYEIFDYPGEYRVRGDGEADIRIRMEEEEAAHEVVTGSSQCCTFTPGGKFTLKTHQVAEEAGQTYVLTAVQHSAKETSWEGSSGAETYRNTFSCIPAAVVFRPERSTPKPVVQGVQTAVVVGPTGEKIFCDKYGRVKVQFFWDRLGKKNEKSSCWVRVSHNWGGGNWGGMFLPHMGQEVIVGFEEGDPDRPLIVGRVYNAEQMPPLALPENKTQSLLRDHGGNQIVMEGMGAKQQILMHSPHSNTSMLIGGPSPSLHRFRGSGRGAGPDDNVALVEDSVGLLDSFYAKNADADGADGPGGHFTGGFVLSTDDSWYAHMGLAEVVHVGENAWRWVSGESHTVIVGPHTLNMTNTSDIVTTGEATETYHHSLKTQIDVNWTTVVTGNVDDTVNGVYGLKVTGGDLTFNVTNGNCNITTSGKTIINNLAGTETTQPKSITFIWGADIEFVGLIKTELLMGPHIELHTTLHSETTFMHVENHIGPHVDTGTSSTSRWLAISQTALTWKMDSLLSTIGGGAMKILGF